MRPVRGAVARPWALTRSRRSTPGNSSSSESCVRTIRRNRFALCALRSFGADASTPSARRATKS
eukprot:7999923-Alexandrium_andersonii.AAC.1